MQSTKRVNRQRRLIPLNGSACQVNRIHRKSPMQSEKSQSEGKRTMPETRFTETPALSVDPTLWISRSASVTDV